MEAWKLAAVLSSIPAGCAGYGLIEAQLYRLRTYRLPVLPVGSAPVRLLQVSDLHLRNSNRRMATFLRELAEHTYDLVLATGDLLGEPDSVEACLEALNGLKAKVGRYFVFGSGDYYAPRFRNYLDYFLGKRRLGTRRNRSDDLKAGLIADGWIDLTNLTVFAALNGTQWQITGLDDPYLRRDDRSLLVRDPSASLALGVVHDPAPYLEAARAGFDLLIAGHTHGGQVRLPLVGALVTNSELPRRYARGLHRINESWLFVSPGLGTSKYAPFRFMCPPEASLLELVGFRPTVS